MKLAVVTYEARGSYAAETVPDEDLILSEILNELNVSFEFEIWSDTSVNWSKYELILVKSPWDYFDRYAEFLLWCDVISQLGIPVWNPIEVIKWNSDKRYLHEIQEKGFPIVPTRFLEKGSKLDLLKAFEEFDADQLIFKPSVSGGAKNTIKISRDDWKNKKASLTGLLAEEAYLLQPFLKEVAEIGEYSYLYFDGKFSHAILKKAKKGDFRVQHFFGGSIEEVKPNPEELEYFDKLLQAFAKDCLYARVDGVWTEGVFYLMELELIEPYLFLFLSDTARENYKSALKKRLVEFSVIKSIL
ncbi:ATP-grasp domain-containing protein [Arthrospiribacter ruber]|uniref:Glutathione synthetase n=1 Tax=Arthrospiribacter ruber TaxID=2487934 RepID=A0A951IY07_9BACT|nr:glutathione synthetase [Arthrospiribacter ruber]MBW3468427.1 glutathione synthetase [Arthrospiribacter ruber]